MKIIDKTIWTIEVSVICFDKDNNMLDGRSAVFWKTLAPQYYTIKQKAYNNFKRAAQALENFSVEANGITERWIELELDEGVENYDCYARRYVHYKCNDTANNIVHRMLVSYETHGRDLI